MMKLIIIGIAGIIIASGCQQHPRATDPAPWPPEIAKAIHDFQATPDARHENDYAVPRKLLPLLESGLSQNGVKAILGDPSRVNSNSGGIYWHYGLFYSQFIDIHFDSEGRVQKVISTIDNK
jgi:hypothetical protein